MSVGNLVSVDKIRWVGRGGKGDSVPESEELVTSRGTVNGPFSTVFLPLLHIRTRTHICVDLR